MTQAKTHYTEWYARADEYYLAARALQWFSGTDYPATFTAHHALELYFKAIIVRENDGEYQQKHTLRKLYNKVKKLNSRYNTHEVDIAVEKFNKYDLAARYGVIETDIKPTNKSMGTANLRALDKAVLVLRDLSVTTQKGLDRIIAGETEFTKHGFRDSHLSLNSVILFHSNEAFKPQKSEILKEIDFRAPRWPVTDEEQKHHRIMEQAAKEGWSLGELHNRIFDSK